MLHVHTFLEKSQFHSWRLNRGHTWMWLDVAHFLADITMFVFNIFLKIPCVGRQVSRGCTAPSYMHDFH